MCLAVCLLHRFVEIVFWLFKFLECLWIAKRYFGLVAGLFQRNVVLLCRHAYVYCCAKESCHHISMACSCLKMCCLRVFDFAHASYSCCRCVLFSVTLIAVFFAGCICLFCNFRWGCKITPLLSIFMWEVPMELGSQKHVKTIIYRKKIRSIAIWYI